jgi:glyoxylase-like metal-dependent hydrolase (beta-lactamase superfamily II)
MVIKMGWIRNEGRFNDDSYLIDGNIWGMKGGLACYYIEGSERNVLIDVPGIEDTPKMVEKIKSMSLQPNILILTHSHWDHSGGVPILKENFPDVEIMISHQGIDSVKNISVFNEAYSNVTTGMKPITEITPIKQDSKIDLGKKILRIFETPGHSNCSISVLDEKNEVLYIGDSFGNLFRTDLHIAPIMPPEYSHLKLMESFEKIKGAKYKSIALSHFGIVTEDLAEHFFENAEKAYLSWREFYLDVLRRNDDKGNFFKELSKKIESFGINPQFAEIYANREGNWVYKALKQSENI